MAIGALRGGKNCVTPDLKRDWIMRNFLENRQDKLSQYIIEDAKGNPGEALLQDFSQRIKRREIFYGRRLSDRAEEAYDEIQKKCTSHVFVNCKTGRTVSYDGLVVRSQQMDLDPNLIGENHIRKLKKWYLGKRASAKLVEEPITSDEEEEAYEGAMELVPALGIIKNKLI